MTHSILPRLAVAFCLSLAVAVPSYGSDQSSVIQAELDAGQYELAADKAEALGTVEGYILAAESLSAEILIAQAKKPKKQAKRALKLAKEALELEPDNAEAKIQYALAYGFKTRETSDTSAWVNKLPIKTQNAIDAAIAAAPRDGRPLALLASWHAGIRIKNSDYANNLYGASAQKAVSLYQEAKTLSPNDVIIAANSIITMAGLDAAGYRDAIDREITAFMRMPNKNAVEEVYKKRMTELLGIQSDAARQNRAVEWLSGEP